MNCFLPCISEISWLCTHGDTQIVLSCHNENSCLVTMVLADNLHVTEVLSDKRRTIQ
jgi:hypothetical protein